MNRASSILMIIALLFVTTACAGNQVYTATPAVAVELFPESEKGYELYHWHRNADNAWYYTLITGTNRLKTYQEVVADPEGETEAGWVKITADGADALRALLSRLPRGSEVFLLGPQWLLGAGAEEELINVVAVPGEMEIEQLKKFCQEFGLVLHLSD